MNQFEYQFAQLLCHFDDEFKKLSFYEQYRRTPKMYNDFHMSNYKVFGENEYDNICNYINANAHKIDSIVYDIIESIKNIEGINGEVWKCVSEKLGYTDIMVKVVDKDGIDDEEGIIEPIMYLKRSFVLNGDEYVEILNSKGESVEIWASRIKPL